MMRHLLDADIRADVRSSCCDAPMSNLPVAPATHYAEPATRTSVTFPAALCQSFRSELRVERVWLSEKKWREPIDMQSTFLLDDQHFYTTDIHRLIPALSTAMSHADADDLDAAIELALRGLAEALAVDCAALVEYDDNGATTQTAGWAAVGSANALADAPWGRPRDADIVVVDQMPEEYPRRSGLRAALLVHVTVGDTHR